MMDKASNAAQSAKDSIQEVRGGRIAFFERWYFPKTVCLKILYYWYDHAADALQAGQQAMAKAQGAADAVKDAANKWKW